VSITGVFTLNMIEIVNTTRGISLSVHAATNVTQRSRNEVQK